jgi:hypothetical protein
MNKRDRQELRASLAKDLIKGQGEHSPTRGLLRHYAPLEGIIATPDSGHSLPSQVDAAVQITMPGGAALARNDDSAWPGANVAQHATLTHVQDPTSTKSKGTADLRRSDPRHAVSDLGLIRHARRLSRDEGNHRQ